MKKFTTEILLILAGCAMAVGFVTASPSAGMPCSPYLARNDLAFPSIPCFEKEGRIVEGYNWVWGENVGWVNLRARHADLRIGSNVLAGWICLDNCGWVYAGDGRPLDGKRYSNRSARDWGVNNDGEAICVVMRGRRVQAG